MIFAPNNVDNKIFSWYSVKSKSDLINRRFVRFGEKERRRVLLDLVRKRKRQRFVRFDVTEKEKEREGNCSNIVIFLFLLFIVPFVLFSFIIFPIVFLL